MVMKKKKKMKRKNKNKNKNKNKGKGKGENENKNKNKNKKRKKKEWRRTGETSSSSRVSKTHETSCLAAASFTWIGSSSPAATPGVETPAEEAAAGEDEGPLLPLLLPMTAEGRGLLHCQHI